MDTSSESTSFLDPNFALNLYAKFGQVTEIVPKIKLIIEEFRKISASSQSTPLTRKNNSKSNEFREEAERYSSNKDEATLLRVLEIFNKSICFAEPANREQLAVLYASRAGVYFDLKEYEICLENVSLAEGNGYPDDRASQLNELKTDSLELLQKLSHNRKEKRGETEIQLNVKSHQRIPFAASCLELKTDSVRGRYITTNADIAAGSIIISERPFERVLSGDCIYQRCSNCFHPHSLNLLPCPNCTKAMFCSNECMREAFKGFHQFECPIIDCLYDVGGQITTRTFLKAIHSFDSMEQLIEFVQSKDTHNLTAFSFNHSEELSPQQHYQQIHSLSTNHDIRPELDLFTHAMVTALFYYQLSSHTSLKDVMEEGCRDSLIELMFRIELITTINSFDFNDLSSLQDDYVIGTAMYQLSSLINHSCHPNACPKYHNTNLILYTTQPIKQGEAISIGYNGSHAFLPKHKRQSFLIGKYHFLCQCVACANNFPLLCNMALANIPEIHSNGLNIQLDRKIAENIYRKCCAHLQEFYRNYPCKEVYSVQMCLAKLLSYLLRNDDSCPVELCIGKLGHVNPNDIVF